MPVISEGEDKVVALLILLLRLAVTDHYRQRLIKGPSPDPELNQSLVVAASQYLNSAKPSSAKTQAIGRRPKEQVQRNEASASSSSRRKVTATNQSILCLPDQSACTYAGRHHALPRRPYVADRTNNLSSTLFGGDRTNNLPTTTSAFLLLDT